jgi:hypothetical protein
MHCPNCGASSEPGIFFFVPCGFALATPSVASVAQHPCRRGWHWLSVMLWAAGNLLGGIYHVDLEDPSPVAIYEGANLLAASLAH